MELVLRVSRHATKAPCHIDPVRVASPRRPEYVLSVRQTRAAQRATVQPGQHARRRRRRRRTNHLSVSAKRLAVRMQHQLRRVRDVPRSAQVVGPIREAVAAHDRLARLVHHVVQEVSVRVRLAAVPRRLHAVVAELRKHPQVAPARQRVRLQQAVVRKHKAAVVSAVVLLLPHAILHHLHRPLHLPRVLGNIHHALRVRRHHGHVEQLVDVQIGRVDAPSHHRTVAVHGLGHHIRVTVVDLGPVVQHGAVLPPVSETVRQRHVQTRIRHVNRHLTTSRALKLARNHVRAQRCGYRRRTTGRYRGRLS